MSSGRWLWVTCNPFGKWFSFRTSSLSNTRIKLISTERRENWLDFNTS